MTLIIKLLPQRFTVSEVHFILQSSEKEIVTGAKMRDFWRLSLVQPFFLMSDQMSVSTPPQVVAFEI